MTIIRRCQLTLMQCRGRLQEASAMVAAMKLGCDSSGATVCQVCEERFQPHGLTVVLILAESHFIVSTWPEHASCTVDVSVCAAEIDLQVLLSPLIELLEPVRSHGQLSTTDLIGTNDCGNTTHCDLQLADIYLPADDLLEQR